MKNIWNIYKNQEVIQEFSSAKTARIQEPRTLKIIEATGLISGSPVILDLGCGSGNQKFKSKLESAGVNYNGCDPFNQPIEVNLKSIANCMDGQADIVVINNVLNTIREPEVWEGILRQAENAVNPKTGRVLIITYEGEKNSEEKRLEKETGKKIKTLKPLETRDGWQNRTKTESYLEAVKNVFPNVNLQNMGSNGGKVISAAVNVDLDMDLKQMVQNKKEFAIFEMVEQFGEKTEQKKEEVKTPISAAPEKNKSFKM